MDNKHYQIYMNNVLAFVQSIVLKSEYTAQRINDKLYLKYGDGTYDASDRTTWKYYLNLAGEYHSTDTVMTVRSFDTLEEIEFNKYNLDYHLATKSEYQIGSERYTELVERYPEQEALIMGILNPVPMEIAIDAPEFKILTYRDDLVESNEYSLIYFLQTTIDGMVGRYFNQQFNRSDDLYYACFFACIYMNLIPATGIHRKRMARTSEAHSFHQFQFISSYTGLAAGFNQMSLQQRLFFIRNADYLMHYAGTKRTFNIVKEKLVDSVGIPLSSLVIEQDDTSMPTDVRPKIAFRKEALNDVITGEMTDTQSVATVMDAVTTLASGNSSVRGHYDELFDRRAVNNLANRTTTKLLESSFVEDEGGDAVPLEDTVLMHWLLLSQYDYIKTVHEFVTPVSGVKFTLSAKDAYIFYMYCFYKYIGMDIVTVPIVRASRVQRIPSVTFNDVMKLVGVDSDVPPDFLNDIVETMPYPVAFYSTESFKQYWTEIHKQANRQIDLLATIEGLSERGDAGIAVESLWMTVDMDLGIEYTLLNDKIEKSGGVSGVTFEEWFRLKGIAVERIVAEDYDTLWQNIVEVVTGLEVGTSESKKTIQASMTRLLASFSSYSTRIVINNRTSRKLHAGTVSQRYRIKRVRTGSNARIRINEVGVKAIRSGFYTRVFDNLRVNGVGFTAYHVYRCGCVAEVDPSISVVDVRTGYLDYGRAKLEPAGPLSVNTYVDR